ncbi:MAG: hypothetical protein A3J38_05070 [Gammaproteobacteria bacterium RIFCSPHIGHO2_12_FULL_45_9]|nr:MAG: hypothetical protein A3J38_05070 [Gammaproteobacteria bacterium RIFCSPHIGHO2_12_FULL_45_9]
MFKYTTFLYRVTLGMGLTLPLLACNNTPPPPPPNAVIIYSPHYTYTPIAAPAMWQDWCAMHHCTVSRNTTVRDCKITTHIHACYKQAGEKICRDMNTVRYRC